jgi:hypothetical protein
MKLAAEAKRRKEIIAIEEEEKRKALEAEIEKRKKDGENRRMGEIKARMLAERAEKASKYYFLFSQVACFADRNSKIFKESKWRKNLKPNVNVSKKRKFYAK